MVFEIPEDAIPVEAWIYGISPLIKLEGDNISEPIKPPVFLTESIPDAILNKKYQFLLEINNTDSDYPIIFGLLVAPSWLSINVSGELSGTPKSENDIGAEIPIIIRAEGPDGFADTLFTTLNVFSGTVSIKEDILINYYISEPFPNPFNPSTTFEYHIPAEGQVNLTIYNVNGQAVCKLKDEYHGAGNYSVTWNANEFPNGLYFCTLTANGFIDTRKMLLIK